MKIRNSVGTRIESWRTPALMQKDPEDNFHYAMWYPFTKFKKQYFNQLITRHEDNSQIVSNINNSPSQKFRQKICPSVFDNSKTSTYCLFWYQNKSYCLVCVDLLYLRLFYCKDLNFIWKNYQVKQTGIWIDNLVEILSIDIVVFSQVLVIFSK